MSALGTIFLTAYADLGRMLKLMPWPVAIIAVVSTAQALVTLLVGTVVTTTLGQSLASTLCAVGTLYVTAPYSIALYRLVASGEIVEPRRLRGTPAARLYFAWSALLAFAAAAIAVVEALVTGLGLAATLFGVLLTFAATVFIFSCIFRTITLQPAAALDRPTSLAMAFAQTRGRFWFTLVTYLATLLPVLAPGLLAIQIANNPVATLLIAAVIGPTATLLAISLSTQLYLRFTAARAS
jgi:hypothetical protein